MEKVSKADLKRKILNNFIKLIESRPELHKEPSLVSAYKQLKSRMNEK